MKAKLTAMLCVLLIAGRCFAGDELKPTIPTVPTTVQESQGSSGSSPADVPYSKEHPYIYAAGYGALITVLGYALYTAVQHGGSHDTYNIGGSFNESNGNGQNGSSASNDGDVSQTTGGGGSGNNSR